MHISLLCRTIPKGEPLISDARLLYFMNLQYIHCLLFGDHTGGNYSQSIKQFEPVASSDKFSQKNL